MGPFQTQVLSLAEIHALLTELSNEEVEQARAKSLTPLKHQILYEGLPASALVRDTKGNEYIDCTAQAWTLNVGYCHPDILAAVIEQMQHLTHVRYGYPTIPRIKLINRLPQLFPGNLKKVVLNNQGGGTTVEAAMKLALINRPGASTFLVAHRGYHGATLVTLAASHYMPGLARFPGFGLDHFVRFPYPHCYRCPIQHDPRTCGLACLELVEEAIRYGAGAPVAGLIIEPMQGAGGQVPTPSGYLAGLKDICQRHGVLLIFDECQTAFGRIGTMSAAEYYGVVPDILVLSKALGGGFPIGAVLAREDLKGFTLVEEHTTFGSNPIAFAAALVNIEVILRLGLPGRARRLGERATARLRQMQETHSLIGDVRGPGLFIGVELVEDRETKQPATERAAALVEMAIQQGVIFDLDLPDVVNGRPARRNVVKIKPPLTITEEQLDHALDVFEATLAQVTQFPPEMLEMIRQKMVEEAIPR
ncbi:MAG TPA: aspartate aminotransferase family protein [Chloroflexi bacterium]|nr:aspartate aminotransferase family protein [Chloroflexota bacterium]